MSKFRKAVVKLMAAVMMTSVLIPTLPVKAAVKSFELGRQDPKEVVATVNSDTKTVTLTMDYVYDPDGNAEELPNPGYMTDQKQALLVDYMMNNSLTGYTLIIEQGVKSIGSNAFTGSDAFSTIINNSSVLEKIGANAFSSNPNLTSVDLGTHSLTKIEPNTFYDCPNLTSINITGGIRSIETGAFMNTGITEFLGGDSLTSIAPESISGGSKIVIGTDNDVVWAYDWFGNGYIEFSDDVGSSYYTVEFVTGVSATTPVQFIKGGELATEPTVADASNTFIGWFSDAAFANPFSFETPIETNMVLYGKWRPNQVTITFDRQNGGTNDSVTIDYGGKVTKPSDPLNGEKVFAGWFKDQNGTTAVNFDTDTFDRDTTLYAKYVDPTYHKVSFEVGDDVESIAEQSIKSGGLVARPTDPAREDYTFDGWYTNDAYETEWDFNKNTVTKDMTLYSKWKYNFVTVKFETNGAGSVAAVTVERGDTVAQPTAPTKENSEFLGWFKDEGCTELYSFESKVTSDMTLYAGWNQTAFTVKFESNGGTAVAAITANPNTLIAKPADPTKEGYHLEAWCSDSALTTAWNFDVNQVTSDITLYAKWAAGDPPGVTNTGAAVPQTGDNTSAVGTIVSLFSTLGMAAVGKKKFF